MKPDSRLAAAQTALVALGVSLRSQTAKIRFHGRAELFPVDQAAAYLESLVKPVQCAAASIDGLLEISVEPLSPNHEWLHKLLLKQAAGIDPGVIPSNLMQGDNDDGIVLLKSTTESLYLPIAAIREWYRSYVMLDCSFSGAPPTEEQLANRTLWVVRSEHGVGRAIQIGDRWWHSGMRRLAGFLGSLAKRW